MDMGNFQLLAVSDLNEGYSNAKNTPTSFTQIPQGSTS